jgi:hypothetical protein
VTRDLSDGLIMACRSPPALIDHDRVPLVEHGPLPRSNKGHLDWRPPGQRQAVLRVLRIRCIDQSVKIML